MNGWITVRNTFRFNQLIWGTVLYHLSVGDNQLLSLWTTEASFPSLHSHQNTGILYILCKSWRRNLLVGIQTQTHDDVNSSGYSFRLDWSTCSRNSLHCIFISMYIKNRDAIIRELLTKPIISNTQAAGIIPLTTYFILHKMLCFLRKLGMWIPTTCLSTYPCPMTLLMCCFISVIYDEGIQSLKMSDSYMLH